MFNENAILTRCFLLGALLAALTGCSVSTRTDTVIDSGWHFAKSAADDQSGISDWEQVSVPHTWNAIDGADGNPDGGGGGDSYYRAACWYKRDMGYDKAWEGKRVFIRFEGACLVSDVYLNGAHLGQHRGAFGAFCYELTPYLLKDKANLLTVKVDNRYQPDVPPLSGDFTMFGGIYRPVHLIVTGKTCISPLDYASPGVYLTQTEVSRARAEVEVKAVLSNTDTTVKEAVVSAVIRDAEGETVAASRKAVQFDGGAATALQTLTIDNPRLWQGRSDPYLYSAEVMLEVGGEIVDSVTQPLGLRFTSIHPEKGFMLNGRPCNIRGVNRHQDRQGMGWAITEKEHDEDHALIMEVGANGVRLAHYPQSGYFYGLCDQSGLMVWAEIPLVNRVKDTPEFNANVRQQLLEMIRQHYNHPSIVMWGLFNELYHRRSDPCEPLVKELNQLAHLEDPTRFTVAAPNKFNRKALNRIPDHCAFNGYPGWYGGGPDGMGSKIDTWYSALGEKGVAVSEYGAGASIKHHEELPPKRPTPRSSWHPEEWQSYLHERNYASIAERPYCWGSFVWNMFDFASDERNEGDHPGRNDKGLVTYDRKVKKDAFFFYKANWNKNDPLVYISSRRYVERREKETRIKVYSTAKEVELFINGKSRGVRPCDELCRAIWDKVALEEGTNTIEARAEINGTKVSDQCEWIFTVPPMQASASNSEKGNFPRKAIDGKMDTRWGSGELDPIWQVAFKEPRTISAVEIAWFYGHERIYPFEMEVSRDGKEWTQVFAGKSSGKHEEFEAYRFEAVEASFLRIKCHGNNDNHWSSFWEVRFD